jgi:RIO-like serine/threonine protein kinase
LKTNEELLKYQITAEKALRELHGRGVVHGDAHIQNVLIDKDGQAHWIDFGKSEIMSELSPSDAESKRKSDFEKLMETFHVEIRNLISGHKFDRYVDEIIGQQAKSKVRSWFKFTKG